MTKNPIIVSLFGAFLSSNGIIHSYIVKKAWINLFSTQFSHHISDTVGIRLETSHWQLCISFFKLFIEAIYTEWNIQTQDSMFLYL